MPKPLSILWFRQDLRLDDNPALAAAREAGGAVLPVFVLDETVDHPPGGASRWWLHHSLKALAADLEKLGAPLILRRGPALEIIPDIAAAAGATHVFWNRRYAADQIDIDKKLKKQLSDDGVCVESFNGSLLTEPWELKTGTGGYYKVFTPFWKALKAAGPARAQTIPRPRKLDGAKTKVKSDKLSDWGLLPKKPNWAKDFAAVWTPGEKARGKDSTIFSRIRSTITKAAAIVRTRNIRPACRPISPSARLVPYKSGRRRTPKCRRAKFLTAPATNSCQRWRGASFPTLSSITIRHCRKNRCARNSPTIPGAGMRKVSEPGKKA